jgi:hypothetical protein
MMKHAFLALALLSASSITAAEAAAKFEGAMLPNSGKSNPAFFRIEVATGKVVSVWGYGVTQFMATAEKAPLPAGEYHLFAVSNPQTDGTVFWSMDRLEANTGRTWNLTGGGNDPFVWVEVGEPK